MCQPWPNSTTRLRAGVDSPPTQMGGWGFLGWLGREVQVTVDLDKLAVKAWRFVGPDFFHDRYIFPCARCAFFVWNAE